MKLNSWLLESTKLLQQSGIVTARLDCLVLLEDTTKKDRSWLLAHPETTLQGATLKTLEAQVRRREKHEPLAYIRGKSEFYGREFIVNAHTLEPRAETETMIDLLKNLHYKVHYKVAPCNVVDVGTGSGCLAITANLELPGVTVFGTDIDSECIKIARQNAKRYKVNIEFFTGDLLEALPSSIFHLPSSILANLPYVPDSHTINPAAMFEPRQAIFGGNDGLDIYRRLFGQIKNLKMPPQFVLTESLPFQHKELAKIAKNAVYNLNSTNDFIQQFTLG